MAGQAQRKAASDLDALQAELPVAQRRAERGEAALAHQLLATLRVAPHERDGGRQRKAGRSTATTREDQGEERGEAQGAPVLPGHLDDGDDSSDRRDTSEGLTWDGQGEMPSWLTRAVNAGQSVEFYRVG